MINSLRVLVWYSKWIEMYKIKSCVIYIVRYYYGFLANKRLLLTSKRTVAEGSAAADACYEEYMTCLGLRKYNYVSFFFLVSVCVK